MQRSDEGATEPGSSKVEEEFLDLLKDAKIGKHKHFHAAQRKQNWHMRLGITALLLTSFASFISAISDALHDSVLGQTVVSVSGMALPAAAAVFVGLQTFLRLEKMIEGHRTIANGYLELHRDGKAAFAKRLDGRMTIEELDELFADCRAAYHKLNRESEAFATSPADLASARGHAPEPE
jgi:hypothetical protein